jgi:hypothetical protein
MPSLEPCNSSSVVSLPAERRALAELGLAARGPRDHGAAAGAANLRRGVGVDGGDVEARRALDIHEVRVGALHEAGTLVLAALCADCWIREICVKESHFFCLPCGFEPSRWGGKRRKWGKQLAVEINEISEKFFLFYDNIFNPRCFLQREMKR